MFFQSLLKISRPFKNLLCSPVVHRPTFSVPSVPGLCAGPLPCFLLPVEETPASFAVFFFELGDFPDLPFDCAPCAVEEGEDEGE